VRAGDNVQVRSTSSQNATIQHAMEEVKGRGIPEWLLIDAGALSGRVSQLPNRQQINLPVQEQLIVELYSK
jgi:small subunit ribosomal protein S4